MLLIDKMKSFKFSNNKRVVVNYILEKQELIRNYSTKAIADATYTSPSILIRIAKKLNFPGCNALKEAYINELSYLKKHFQGIDANLPFNSNDSTFDIVNKIGQLYMESIMDTLSLFNNGSLKNATELINKSSHIQLFAASRNIYVAKEFSFKLNRINKSSRASCLVDDIYFDARRCSSNECAIVISYSGKTLAMLKICELLEKNNVPIIAITSIGHNALSKYAKAVLHITTREKEFSKIANYSSLTSINIVLDILYFCLFSLNYHDNLNFKINLSKQIEFRNHINNKIIKENIE